MPCNQVPSIRRHKAQTRITILFALIALALTALPTVSFAGTDTAGNVLATEVDSTPSGIEGDLYWAGQSLNLDDAPSAAILSRRVRTCRFAIAP